MMHEAGTRRGFLKTSAAALGTLAWPAGAYAAGDDGIRVGLVGCGGRGPSAVLNALAVDKGARLVAMADIFQDRIRRQRTMLQQKFPEQVAVDDARCFSGIDGYKHVIECSDVVLIACAAKFHPIYLLKAVEAGKHVFVEKPHAVDPAGIRVVEAAVRLAREKGLSVLSGLQSRYDAGFQETVRRIHEGAIGEVVAIEENFLRSPYGIYRRKPGMTELQYQFGNQYHFSWLSGDDVPQSLVHNIDRSTWVLKGQAPVKCHGLGGRSSSFGELFGDVFDHHSVVYEYEGGVRLYAFCRTQTDCYDENSSIVLGTKGRCFLRECRIEGEKPWRYEGARPNPYEAEHRAFFGAIRSGKPISSGDYMARSTMATIMGQISCYTGKEVTWAQATGSDLTLGPKPEECTLEMEPPVRPDEKGNYPLPVPGVTKLL